VGGEFVIFGDKLQQKPRKKMIAAFHFDISRIVPLGVV